MFQNFETVWQGRAANGLYLITYAASEMMERFQPMTAKVQFGSSKVK
jgi:hypothetical protein